jgi:hypothetical protein
LWRQKSWIFDRFFGALKHFVFGASQSKIVIALEHGVFGASKAKQAKTESFCCVKIQRILTAFECAKPEVLQAMIFTVPKLKILATCEN